MSGSKALRAALILLFGFGVLLVAQPIGAGDAEAKRGLRAAATGVGAYRAVTREKPAEEGSEESNSADGETSEAENSDTSATDATEGADPKAERDASSQAATAASVTAASPPAAATKPVVLRSLDREIPGCAPGMLCTVCVAGCNGPSNSIIHASPKPQQ